MRDRGISRSYFESRDNFFAQLAAVIYLGIGFVSFMVSGLLAIYHESFHDLAWSPLHIVAWPVMWGINIASWSHASQMILAWVVVGVYLGIGCCCCLVDYFFHLLGGKGDLLTNFIVCLPNIPAWPLYFVKFWAPPRR